MIRSSQLLKFRSKVYLPIAKVNKVLEAIRSKIFKPNKIMQNFINGANLDKRTNAEKDLDFKFNEIAQTPEPIVWIEKESSNIRRFPIFNQDGSGSCVAQTQAKEMGIMRWLKDKIYVHFSAGHIYQRRVDKSQPGMGADDARKIAQQGVTLEVLAPSQNMNDNQMDSLTIEDYKNDVGKIFAVSNYIQLPAGDIDAVASVIQKTGKGVMVWFYFNLNEWTAVPEILYPSLNVYNAQGRHSVCAVDFCLIDGKKCLIIDDSWGSSYGLAGQRTISEDFFKARNWYSGYLMSFKFDVNFPKPKYTFTIPLEFGMQGNIGVKNLQDCLKYYGFFPTNIQSTGNYFAITAKAVYDWQVANNVALMAELNALAGKRFGDKSIKSMNELLKC